MNNKKIYGCILIYKLIISSLCLKKKKKNNFVWYEFKSRFWMHKASCRFYWYWVWDARDAEIRRYRQRCGDAVFTRQRELKSFHRHAVRNGILLNEHSFWATRGIKACNMKPHAQVTSSIPSILSSNTPRGLSRQNNKVLNAVPCSLHSKFTKILACKSIIYTYSIYIIEMSESYLIEEYTDIYLK